MNRSLAAESIPQAGQSDPFATELSSSEKKDLRTSALLAMFLPLLGMIPLLALQAQSLFQQPRYFYFPLVIAIGAWLLFRTGGSRMATGLRAHIALCLSILGIGLAVLGTFWFSPWIVQFGSVVVIFAWALGSFAKTAWTRIFAICCLFAVAVPPPGTIDNSINSRLQSVVSWGCNGFLDAVGIPNIVEGNLMEISDKKIRLSDVCGGADSLAALLAVGMILVVLRRCTFAVGLATLVAVPICYVLANIVRLLVVAFGFEYYATDLTNGTGYLVTTILFSLGAVASLLLTHISIAAILEPIASSKGSNNLTALYRLLMSWPKTKDWSPELESPSASTKPVSAMLRYRTALIGVPSLICLLLGGLAGYVAIKSARSNVADTGMSEEQAAVLPSQSAFPIQFGNLKMTGFTPTVKSDINPLGRYSNLWKFEDKGSQLFATLDFPFQGWRPVWAGYQANGWKILKVEPVDPPANAGNNNLYVEEFKMQNQYGLYGYVWFAFFDEQAVPTAKDSDAGGGRINVFTRLQKPIVSSSTKYFQVQLFLESGRELTELETANNRKLYFEIFERIRVQSEAVLKKAQ